MNNDKPKRELLPLSNILNWEKVTLYESVFINNGLPVFIKYNDKLNEFESIRTNRRNN